MVVVMLALFVPIVGMGVYPDAALRRIEPSVVRTLRTVETRMVHDVDVDVDVDETESPGDAPTLEID